jgi:protein involved in ribonucleotide reduction
MNEDNIRLARGIVAAGNRVDLAQYAVPPAFLRR